MKLLFVCTGNICRSPSAAGVMRTRLAACGLDGRFQVDAAGTHGYHIGDPPDPRSCAVAAARGYDLSDLVARQVRPADFRRFDLLIAMDRGHQRFLRGMAPAGTEDRIRLFMDFAPRFALRDVPDPYYGDDAGFERTLDLIEAGVDGLIGQLQAMAADGP